MDTNTDNRDNLLSAVWLLATLNGDGMRKPGRKSVIKIDIVETCQCIINMSGTLNLRKTSNLMYGTVIAYKNKCLWNWKEVNSCRMLIRRLGMMTTTYGKDAFKSGNNEEIEAGNVNSKIQSGTIKLLPDDPKFDIMFGLVEEFEEFSQNQDDGSKERDIFEKSTSGSDDNSSSSVENEVFEDKEGIRERWDEAKLDFQFDDNGDIIQLKEQGDAKENTILSEAEIKDNFADFNAFEELPEFGIAFENTVTELPIVEESILTPPPTKRQKRGKNGQHTRKRLIFDSETCITGLQLRDIRDGYIVSEKEKLKERYFLAKRSQWEAELKALADVKKYNNGYTVREREAGLQNERVDDRLPSFDDIEYGRERMESRSRSRSSSVSSVEVGRRAVDSRHSSSFRFDFSQREGEINVGETNIADVAQMDISFRLDNLDEFDEIESVGRADIESFEEEVRDRCPGAGGTALFSDLTFANNAKEVSCKFMFVLELATKNRIRVSQESLFSEIFIELR